jgi:hypothetical protein
MAVCDAILHDAPREFGDLPVPGKLKAIIGKLLEKDPANRYQNAAAVEQELRELQESLTLVGPVRLSRTARISVAAAAVMLCLLAGWFWYRLSRERWARQSAVPEIARLLNSEEYVRAAALAHKARLELPKDPTLEDLYLRSTAELSVTSEPSGASVSIRPYRGYAAAWQQLGETPLKQVRVPKTEYLWRVSKPGFAPFSFILGPPFMEDGHASGHTQQIAAQSLLKNVVLWPEQSVPPGMVVVKGLQTSLGWPFSYAAQFRPDDFLIDQHEVTNEEYKKFVDAGGYQKPE